MTKWDWAEPIVTLFLGVVSGILGVFTWFNRRLREMNSRIDGLKDLAAEHMAARRVQEAHHEANLIRLSRMERSIGTLDEKQDQQLLLLAGLAKGQSAKRGD